MVNTAENGMQINRVVVNDPAFEIIPKGSTFFLIWRIEKMELKPLPKEEYGKFHVGDAYIVACASEYKQEVDSQMEPKPAKNRLYIHIHFWIGSKATVDEAGVAAIKTVEMDEYLGGSPVQHRETEGYESQRFLSYFKNGIRLLKGGVGTGFRKVDFTVNPELFQIKGKRNPVVKQLKQVNWLPFNDGDIFILATGKYIFIWIGKHANRFEKIHAIKIAQELKGEHKYCESIVIVEDGNELFDLSGEELTAFEQYLPLDKKVVDRAGPKDEDTKYEQFERSDLTLYRCTDSDGSLSVTRVKNGPLLQSDLDQNDTFIIDNQNDGIWVWVGKKASQKERQEAMKYAHELIKLNNYNPKTKISKVIQNGEHIEFKSLFKSWVNYGESTGLTKPKPLGRVAKVLRESFDADNLKTNHALSAETQLVDDGKGKKEIYHVKGTELLELKPEDWGKFFEENCYLIVYTYNSHAIIYIWSGLKAYADEKHTALTKAIEIDEKTYSGKSSVAKVVQNSEPLHFTFLFSGLMTVFRGRYVVDKAYDDRYMLQVKGTSQYNSKAVQIDLKASSLNSNCVFVVNKGKQRYVWAGKLSGGDKQEMGRRIASKDGNSQVEYILILEGEETDDFWDAIGGKDIYESDQQEKIEHDFHTARLFYKKEVDGKRQLFSEVVNYTQKDLLQDEMMVLDSYDVIFVWIGKQVDGENKTERAFNLAQDFITKHSSVRDVNINVIVVKQDHEPPNFTGFFFNWDVAYFRKTKSYEQYRDEMRQLLMNRFPNK